MLRCSVDRIARRAVRIRISWAFVGCYRTALEAFVVCMADEDLPRRGRGGQELRRGRPLACRRLLPGRGQRSRRAVRRPTARSGATVAHARRWMASLRGWVDGYDVVTGQAKGGSAPTTKGSGSRRSRSTARSRGPWSRPCIRTSRRPLTQRRTARGRGDRRVVAEHATTRVGPRGLQVQVPVDGSKPPSCVTTPPGRRPASSPPPADQRARAGGGAVARTAHGRRPRQPRRDQRHRSRGRHVRPEFRAALAAHGYTLDPTPGRSCSWRRMSDASRHAPGRSATNVDRYEAEWRTEHPDQEPGPQAAHGLGPSRLGRSAARQGGPARRRRDRPALDRGAQALGFRPPEPAG